MVAGNRHVNISYLDEAEQKNVLNRSKRKGCGSTKEEAINSDKAIREGLWENLQMSCTLKVAWIFD